MQQKLTKAEEEIMQHVWRLGRCTVSDILNDIEASGETRPPHSSISSIVRILETKNFVGPFAEAGAFYQTGDIDKFEDGGDQFLRTADL